MDAATVLAITGLYDFDAIITGVIDIAAAIAFLLVVRSGAKFISDTFRGL